MWALETLLREWRGHGHAGYPSVPRRGLLTFSGFRILGSTFGDPGVTNGLGN